MTTIELLNRKGATKGTLIPATVLQLLNRGEMETVNLIEWSAVDHKQLINTVFPQLGLNAVVSQLTAILDNIDKPSVMKCVAAVGNFLSAYGIRNDNTRQLYQLFSTHQSDSIRCYACYIVALNYDLSLVERLELAKPSIADSNFGVREIIWMALRPELVKELEEVLVYLQRWTTDPDERIRRFITEVTRPKGVWTQTIVALKNNPERALPLLEVLKDDESLYVQNSVGNWLNDASKSKPEFVRTLCARWTQESNSKATQYIVKRAMRTLNN